MFPSGLKLSYLLPSPIGREQPTGQRRYRYLITMRSQEKTSLHEKLGNVKFHVAQ